MLSECLELIIVLLDCDDIAILIDEGGLFGLLELVQLHFLFLLLLPRYLRLGKVFIRGVT